MCFKEETEDTYIRSQEYINTIQIIHYIDTILTKILMEIENNNTQIVEDETIETKLNNVQRQKIRRLRKELKEARIKTDSKEEANFTCDARHW